MASTMMRPAIVAAGLLAAFWASAPLAADSSPGAAASGENDLREFRVGMGVDQLPKSGYRGFTCADAADRKLQGWEDYGLCPREASGLHAVRFRYDESVNPLAKVNGLYEGTKVAGHPALLTLLISDNARVEGLVIETDPAAPLFLRKKAFLFGDQVKARWGEEGWSCTEGQPSADEQPVGGVFFKEHCEKAIAAKRLVLDRALFRRAGQELKEFVSRTRLEILGSPSPPAEHG